MDSLPFLVVVLLMVAVVRCLDKTLDDRWERFKTTNNRKYRKEVESKSLLDIDDWLHNHNLKEKVVAGDGHCIIHAAGVSLRESSHNLLQQVVQEIKVHDDYYNLFLPAGVSLVGEIDRWANEKVYQLEAVDLVLSAIANTKECNIVIVEEDNHGVNETHLKPGIAGITASSTIYIIKRWEHYNGVSSTEQVRNTEIIEIDEDEESSCSVYSISSPDSYTPVKTSNRFDALISDDVEIEMDIPTRSPPSTPIVISSDSSPEKIKRKNRSSQESKDDIYSCLSTSSDDDVSSVPTLPWKSLTITSCDELPKDIDGRCIYKLKYNSEERRRMESSRDGRRWKRYFSSKRRDFKGLRRMAHGGGLLECINKTCIYLKQNERKNNSHFDVNQFGRKVCMHCRGSLMKKQCHAVKVWEFPEEEKPYVYIYHDGVHTCMANMARNPPKKELSKIFMRNPQTKPMQAANELIKQSLQENTTWDQIETIADSLLHDKKIRNIKQKVITELHPTGHSFEAIADLKEKADQKDKFYIYRVNDGRLNERSSFVFKSSLQRAEMAIQMDSDGENMLKDEYCYMDFKSSRCKGFKTLGIYVYHKLLKKVLPLALMECENEKAETVSLFWVTFNEMLRDVKGDPNYTSLIQLGL